MVRARRRFAGDRRGAGATGATVQVAAQFAVSPEWGVRDATHRESLKFTG
jgi:hypothetical protein